MDFLMILKQVQALGIERLQLTYTEHPLLEPKILSLPVSELIQVLEWYGNLTDRGGFVLCEPNPADPATGTMHEVEAS